MSHYGVYRDSQELTAEKIVVFPPKRERSREKVQPNWPIAYDFSPIVNALSEGVIIFDSLGRILWSNHAAQDLFFSENDAKDLLNIPFYTLFSPESQGIVHQYFASLRAGTVPNLFCSGQCVSAQNKQGQWIFLRMTLGVLCALNEHFFVIVRPEERDAKSVFEKQGQDPGRSPLHSSNALSLLAHVTHEMRTPLVSIVGFSEMLLQPHLRSPGRIEEYMTCIYKASQHVLTLVNEILETQNFRNEHLNTPFMVLNLPLLMRECVALMGPQAFENHITLRMEGPEVLEIYGHSRSLRQIFLNLLSNGIKFSDSGGKIVLSCDVIEGERVRICCRDTGIGMSPAQIEAVLKGQVQSTWKERRGGMGLGLMLTQQLISAHKGSFSITSEKGRGTCVEIMIPLRSENAPLALAEEDLLRA